MWVQKKFFFFSLDNRFHRCWRGGKQQCHIQPSSLLTPSSQLMEGGSKPGWGCVAVQTRKWKWARKCYFCNRGKPPVQFHCACLPILNSDSIEYDGVHARQEKEENLECSFAWQYAKSGSPLPFSQLAESLGNKQTGPVPWSSPEWGFNGRILETVCTFSHCTLWNC